MNTTKHENHDAVAGQVDCRVRPLSDTQLLGWLRDNLEWDGHGYWLPEICLRERTFGHDFCPELTMLEFREILSERVRAA